MSNEERRSEALEMQGQIDRLKAELRQETALRRQRDTELHALLAHMLTDQYIHRGRIDAEQDVHAALDDRSRAWDERLSTALGQAEPRRLRAV